MGQFKEQTIKDVEKSVTIEIKTEFGTKRAYPVCPLGQLLAELAGKKTFSRGQLETIEKLGYVVEVKADGWK